MSRVDGVAGEHSSIRSPAGPRVGATRALCRNLSAARSLGSLKMVQLAPYVAVVNSDDGIDAPLPSDAAYAHKLREVTVNAPKLKVLGLASGNTTGFVACFNDEKDLFATEHDLRLSEHSRSFEVCEPTSTETLKKSKRSLEDAKAVLVINGQLDGPSGKEFEAMIGAEPACDEFSTAFAAQPGLICKHILRARWESRDSKDRDVIGGCYFFESVSDVETYLNSDFWLKCERETQWKEVVGEVFEIVP